MEEQKQKRYLITLKSIKYEIERVKGQKQNVFKDFEFIRIFVVMAFYLFLL